MNMNLELDMDKISSVNEGRINYIELRKDIHDILYNMSKNDFKKLANILTKDSEITFSQLITLRLSRNYHLITICVLCKILDGLIANMNILNIKLK